MSAGIISTIITCTSLPTTMQYVVWHSAFSQSIMKITETTTYKYWKSET